MGLCGLDRQKGPLPERDRGPWRLEGLVKRRECQLSRAGPNLRTQQLHEVRAVAVLQEYLTPLCAAVEYMIPPIGYQKSKHSCHTRIHCRGLMPSIVS